MVGGCPIEGRDLALVDAAREVGELDPVGGCVDLGVVRDVQRAVSRVNRIEGPRETQGSACSDGGLRRLGFEVVAAVRVGAVCVAVVGHRAVEREDGLVPAVSGSGIRVALHAGLCPQRRPRTWNREASVGVRGTAAEEEEADAHHGVCLR